MKFIQSKRYSFQIQHIKVLNLKTHNNETDI